MRSPELDRLFERVARRLARTTSRRGFLSRIGVALVGAAAWPLLPVSRGSAQSTESPPDDSGLPGKVGDPTSCDYWRYCSIDGFLSACCGGTHRSCPPGTEMSRVTWIGTCRHPADGKDYIISYNDCCGNSFCGRCLCNRNQGDRPVYLTGKSNDINWCMGTSTAAYNSTVAIVLGVATGSS
jgi:methylamine dehydrogenase light chain